MVFVLHEDLECTAPAADKVGPLDPISVAFLPELEFAGGDLRVEAEVVATVRIRIAQTREVFPTCLDLPLHSPVVLLGLEGPCEQAGLY